MSKKTSTPMMEQYHRIKKEHRDALLFFRLGDFYEMFYEDAKVASSVLEIALTSRQKVPMCGVPYHAAHSYLAKLLRQGFKVAVCEQVEDPRQAKGVVKRDVVKILTPGTAVELELGEEKENTYIASLFLHGEAWAMAVVDLSSGEVKVMEQKTPEGVVDELFRIFPREILFAEGQKKDITGLLERHRMAVPVLSPQEDWMFDHLQAKNLLLEHFGVSSLAGFGLEDKDLAVSAAGALLAYIRRLRKDASSLIRSLSYVQSSRYMILDASSIRNLELVRNLRDGRLKDSLLEVIDYTLTPMGGRKLRDWLLHPLVDQGEIERRLEAVDAFCRRPIERQELRESLKGIFDIERLTGKISLSAANAKDLVALKKSLVPLPRIRSLIKGIEAPVVREMSDRWDDLRDILDLIESAILEEPAFLLTEGGLIKKGYNRELDALREISRSGKTTIAGMEEKERKRTGIPSLKIRYNKVFGYYIEITKPNLHLVPRDYFRKQTLVNSERFVTPELKEYEDKVLHAEEKIAELEYRLFLEVRAKLAAEAERLHRVSAHLATLDVFSSLAELACCRNYHRPVVHDGNRVRITGGRHPVVEVTNPEPFIPNDTCLDNETDQILIVTGPNMGGKSTYLRQVALILILAQMGSFVPAEEAEVGIIDRVFTRIGAMDFLSAGRSTFMVEMLETANILHNATSRSLILLDEIGRGTSTFDGLSIAWAVAEYLHEREAGKPKTLFATHYHELTELSLTLERVKNYHVAVKERKGEVLFLRKIMPGPSDQSYGIHVARLAGIPHPVIDRARKILFNLEKKELDDAGRPRIAYEPGEKRDRAQLLLFEEDREREFLETLKEEILGLDINTLSPLEALNVLHGLQEKMKGGGRGEEKN